MNMVGVKLCQSYPKCPEAAVRDVASSREAASLTVIKLYKIDPLYRFLFDVSNNSTSECCNTIASC